MSLTLVLVNRGNMLRRILIPMLALSRKGMVQCRSNDTIIQVRDEERRTVAVVRFEFDHCHLQNRPECIACISLIALSLIVSSDHDEEVTVYGSDRDRNIHFEFRDIGGTAVTRSEITQTLDPSENWGIIYVRMRPSDEYIRGVQMPSREIRRALVLLDLPIYVDLPSVIVHVNHQEVRFTAREQSIAVHGCHAFGIRQDEQLVIRMTFRNIKSYIAASMFSHVVWLFKSRYAGAPDVLACPIMVEGECMAVISYYYFNHPISPIQGD